MNRKRFLAVILAAACVFSFGACGSNDTGVSSSESIPTEQNGEALNEEENDAQLTDDDAQSQDDQNTEQPGSSSDDTPADTGNGTSSGSSTGNANNSAGNSNTSSTTPGAPSPAPEPEQPAAAATKADAQAYIGSSVSALKSAIGQPLSSSYASSCMGDGEDGELHYSGFTVYTYKEGGSEQVVDVE